MIYLARYWADYYSLISQEDHEVEWATVVFYLAAGLIGLLHAVLFRRPFDGLVAAFCLFNGGEEFSWGQRLMGFSPPKYFLEANIQQEVSLHNFFGPNTHDLFFGSVVIGYFVLLPVLARLARGRKLLERIGATAPATSFAPWAILLIVVYVPYPFHLVSEWIEAIVGGLFLCAAALLGHRDLSSKKVLIGVGVVFLFTVILTRISEAQERTGTPERIACAQLEVRNLLDDMLHGGAANEKLGELLTPIHRRVFIAENRGYLNASAFTKFNSTKCAGPVSDDAEVRHRYVIDPWGLSYWVFVLPLTDGTTRLTVYSFGPDRRRDSDEGRPGTSGLKDDDDISATGILVNKSSPFSNGDSLNPVFSIEPDTK
jgi:hypothetical protein